MTAHVRWLTALNGRYDHAIPPGQDRALCGARAIWYRSVNEREQCPRCALELRAPMTLVHRKGAA